MFENRAVFSVAIDLCVDNLEVIFGGLLQIRKQLRSFLLDKAAKPHCIGGAEGIDLGLVGIGGHQAQTKNTPPPK
jgi:hypothetical protein